MLYVVIFAPANNVGTLDPLGWVSVYWRASPWKAVVCFAYSVAMFGLVFFSTDSLFSASQGLNILLNALALTFLVELDEQLLDTLLPAHVRAAVAAEYRDARDKLKAHAGWKWHNTTNKVWVCLFLTGYWMLMEIVHDGPLE